MNRYHAINTVDDMITKEFLNHFRFCRNDRKNTMKIKVMFTTTLMFSLNSDTLNNPSILLNPSIGMRSSKKRTWSGSNQNSNFQRSIIRNEINAVITAYIAISLIDFTNALFNLHLQRLNL